MPMQECTYCERQFTRQEHLSRHIRSHTKEKPFKCRVCGKAYVREDTLRRHAKSHGTEVSRGTSVSESSANPWVEKAVRTTERVSSIFPPSLEQESISSATPDILRDFAIIEPSPRQRISTLTPGSTPVQTVDNNEASGNMWDLENLQFPDDGSLWSFNSDFWMNAVGIEPSSNHAHHGQILSPRYSSELYTSAEPSPSEFIGSVTVLDLRRLWITRMNRNLDGSHLVPSSPETTPSAHPEEAAHIDDQYRRSLTKAFIYQLPQDVSLPSSHFLNLCVRRYFKCFNHLFPIIHSATFRPTPQNGFLLLSIASVGALFLGSQSAAQRGSRLFERLNKAIVTSWDDILSREHGEVVAMVQAALIGQTFALLSGDPRYYAIFDAYHGSVISFARRENMLCVKPETLQIENLEGSDLQAAWCTWARKEEQIRISLALQIHDAELTAMQHTEPLLRQLASKTPLHASSRVFAATTASSWASAVKEETANTNPRIEGVGRNFEDPFTSYLKLEGLGVKIAEYWRDGALDHTVFNAHHGTLLQWYESYGRLLNEDQSDPLCLIILWHWTYMNLLVDFDQLERAIGKDGPEVAKDAVGYVLKWTSSPNSRRCVLHAFLLQKILQSRRHDEVPALHTPRTLFSAAIAWYCYVQYGPENEAVSAQSAPVDINFPELAMLGRDSQSHLSYVTSLCWKNNEKSSIQAATLCEIGYLLQRMSQWGLAKRFANIVASLISGGLDDQYC